MVFDVVLAATLQTLTRIRSLLVEGHMAFCANVPPYLVNGTSTKGQ